MRCSYDKFAFGELNDEFGERLARNVAGRGLSLENRGLGIVDLKLDECN